MLLTCKKVKEILVYNGCFFELEFACVHIENLKQHFFCY